MPNSHATKLQELGGLSAEAIDLRIRDERLRHDEAMGLRMDKLVDRFEKKLELYEEKVDTKLSSIEDKVDSLDVVVRGSIAQVLEFQKTMEAKQEGWHSDDLTYRAGIEEWRCKQEPELEKIHAGVAKVSTEVRELRHRMKLIGWLLMTAKAVKTTIESVADVAEGSKRLGTWIAAISSTFIAIVTFFHVLVPWLRTFWQHHHLW